MLGYSSPLQRTVKWCKKQKDSDKAITKYMYCKCISNSQNNIKLAIILKFSIFE